MPKKRVDDRQVTSVSCQDYAKNKSEFVAAHFPLETRSAMEQLFDIGCKVYGLDVIQSPVKASAKKLQVGTFPDPDQDDFMSALSAKREFRDNKTSYSGKTIYDLCPGEGSPFALQPYQQFLVNFISPLSPYRGVLIFHGVGTGKTSTALSIAENFKQTLSLNAKPSQRRVLLLALNKSIESTFRNTLYNPLLEDIEKRNKMRPGALHPTSNVYFPDVDDTGDRREAARKKYETVYEISDPTSFRSRVFNVIMTVRKNLPESQWDRATRQALGREFSNRLIIVDEVHNIKDKNVERGSMGNFKPYDALRSVVANSTNIRLILMTATPMFNDPNEFIGILNLLLLNDGHQELTRNDIFGDSENDVPTDAGLELLREASRSYISYVRGYNPVSFPRQVEIDDPLVKKLYSKLNEVYLPNPKYDINGKKLDSNVKVKKVKLIRCPMSSYQFKNYLLHGQSTVSRTNVAYREQQNLCNMVYPLGDDTFAGAAGRPGFDQCFRLIRLNKSTKDKVYRYARHCEGFLAAHKLQQYSHKYWLILQNLLLSPGISFVYCENIEIGVETMAMILDANGYEKESGGHYLQDNGVPGDRKVCSICNRLRADPFHLGSRKDHDFVQARYVILQHQDIGTLNTEILTRLKRPNNVRGIHVKVILGSKVTKESFDFSNVRQVHVASAWHNMSKIVQIIGRGVRNCSHLYLPPADRNVVVFRYCTSVPKTRPREIPKELYDTETGDEFFWRSSQNKDIVTKRIERELKTVAVDCLVNHDANYLAGDTDGSRQCDYMSCKYECSTSPLKSNVDDQTSELILPGNELDTAKFFVAKFFATRMSGTFQQIFVDVARQRPRISEKVVAMALSEMLGTKEALPEVIKRVNGDSGYIIQAASSYVFQPIWTKNKQLPVALRRHKPILSPSQAKVYQVDHLSDIELEPSIEDILSRVQADADPVSQFIRIDYLLGTRERIKLVEYLISEQPTSALLEYFENFIIRNDQKRVYGHFLSEVPHCLTPTGWFSCNLEDKKRIDVIQQTLYIEEEAEFVGYMQQKKGSPSFKIVNNRSQKDKTRLDLETALNTLTKGKTCGTYDRTILNSIARGLGVDTDANENKSTLCTKLEYALRLSQFRKKDGKRHFYNIIEAQQRQLLSKIRT